MWRGRRRKKRVPVWNETQTTSVSPHWHSIITTRRCGCTHAGSRLSFSLWHLFKTVFSEWNDRRPRAQSVGTAPLVSPKAIDSPSPPPPLHLPSAPILRNCLKTQKYVKGRNDAQSRRYPFFFFSLKPISCIRNYTSTRRSCNWSITHNLNGGITKLKWIDWKMKRKIIEKVKGKKIKKRWKSENKERKRLGDQEVLFIGGRSHQDKRKKKNGRRVAYNSVS